MPDMRKRACLLLVAGSLLVVGCSRHEYRYASTPDSSGLAYGLGNVDPGVRIRAAKDLRSDDGPPLGAVPQLIEALRREQNPKAKEQMLITLGASGAPNAIPVLDAYLRDPNEDTRDGAETGLKLWSKRTGQGYAKKLPLIAALSSPSWKERRDAAKDLRDDDAVPSNAVEPLLRAAQRERERGALIEELLTLGWSGDPRALPTIRANLGQTDSGVRRAAEKALDQHQRRAALYVPVGVVASGSGPVTGPPPALPVASSAPAGLESTPEEAANLCAQFKSVCGADPFSTQSCVTELTPLNRLQQRAWGECVNASKEACQPAHQACLARARLLR